MRALGIIACIVIAMLALGALVSGDITGPINGFHNQSLGYTILGWTGEIVLLGFVVDTLLLRDERRRWQSVKDKVAKLIDSELTGILIDVNMVTGAGVAVVTLPGNSTEQEEFSELRKATLQKMKELIDDPAILRKEVDPHLFRGDYGTLFASRARHLGDLQLKYWSKFLEPEQMGLIIDLERLLRSLDTHIGIVVKYDKWGQTSELSKLTAREHEGYACDTLKALLALLVENVEAGTITMP
jgi:hypothetical protein